MATLLKLNWFSSTYWYQLYWNKYYNACTAYGLECMCTEISVTIIRMQIVNFSIKLRPCWKKKLVLTYISKVPNIAHVPMCIYWHVSPSRLAKMDIQKRLSTSINTIGNSPSDETWCLQSLIITFYIWLGSAQPKKSSSQPKINSARADRLATFGSKLQLEAERQKKPNGLAWLWLG